jgi:MinD superfamily P-loop ATPase
LKLIDVTKLRELFGKLIWLKMAGYTGWTDVSFSESRKLMDYGFYANEDCIGCGTCEKICPVDNIALVEGTPVWQHNCEQCFACLQWCPQSAIQFGDTEGDIRYHHPDVDVSDLMIDKS